MVAVEHPIEFGPRRAAMVGEGGVGRVGAAALVGADAKVEVPGPEVDREVAVEQGNADAQLNLGGMYRYGHGIPKDYVMAYMWLNLAAAKGNASARINLDNLEKEMTPDQIAEAQRLASEFTRR